MWPSVRPSAGEQEGEVRNLILLGIEKLFIVSFVTYVANIFYNTKRCCHSIVSISKVREVRKDCAIIAFIQPQTLQFQEVMDIRVDECTEMQAHTFSLMFC